MDLDTPEERPGSPPLLYNNVGEYFTELEEYVLDNLHTTTVESSMSWLYSDILSASTKSGQIDYSLPDMNEHLTFIWWHFLTVGMASVSALDQQRLLHFLATVKRLGVLATDVPTVFHAEGQRTGSWNDLPAFEQTFTSTLRTAFLGHRDRRPFNELKEWQNLNTLAARISASQVLDLRFCAVKALRDVLEEDVVVTTSMLEIVAMWLASQGYWLEEMAVYSLAFRKFSDSQRKWPDGLAHLQKWISVVPGSLAKEAGIDSDDVGPRRWRFWRSKLQAFATGDTALSSLATSTLRSMAEI